MPSADLMTRLSGPLRPVDSWLWPGTHYARTAEAWLRNLDAQQHLARPLLRDAYGAAEASRWQARWRLFFLACAELFGYDDGNEWMVAHHLLERPEA